MCEKPIPLETTQYENRTVVVIQKVNEGAYKGYLKSDSTRYVSGENQIEVLAKISQEFKSMRPLHVEFVPPIRIRGYRGLLLAQEIEKNKDGEFKNGRN